MHVPVDERVRQATVVVKCAAEPVYLSYTSKRSKWSLLWDNITDEWPLRVNLSLLELKLLGNTFQNFIVPFSPRLLLSMNFIAPMLSNEIISEIILSPTFSDFLRGHGTGQPSHKVLLIQSHKFTNMRLNCSYFFCFCMLWCCFNSITL